MGREVTDLGCGDGKITKALEKILKPAGLSSVDLSSQLVESAKSRGIDAHIGNLELEDISGDLGILWGVVHHLIDPVPVLKRLIMKFNMLIIRENINPLRIFESGYRFNKREFMRVLEEAGLDLKRCKIVKSNKTKAVIVFYTSSKSFKRPLTKLQDCDKI